jgi:hypothetical protein
LGQSLAASELQKKTPDKSILLPFEVSAIQQQHKQHQQPLGGIDLPRWQQLPTSAPEQPFGDIDLLPWQQPPTSAQDTPSPWLVPTKTTLKADKMAVAKAKARDITSLATIKNQVNKMIGEYINLPFYSPQPEHRVHNAIRELPNHNNWPDNLFS